jgi:archaellum biogenesis protein FlaJ (TadC family)
MVSWISEIFQRPAPMGQYVILVTLLFVATLVISFAVSLTVLIRLPSDYFRTLRAQSIQDSGRGILFRIGIVLKNLLGAILIVIGVILSVPGLPGQGLLTVLAGVFLLDFPGKRSLLYRILSRPLVLRPINRLRMKFSRPPIVIGCPDC